MRLLSIGFLLGTLLIQQFASLPDAKWSVSLLLSPIALVLFWKYRLIIGFISGFLYALWISTSILETRISPTLEGQDLIVRGNIASIPYQRKNGWKFRFNVNRMSTLAEPDKLLDFNGTLRLGWYRTQQIIQAGESWQMVVRLKRPSGFMNPGGFDYEKWLFQERIVATGYVRRSEENRRIEAPPLFSTNSIREKILESINEHVSDHQLAAIVGALAVAERSGVSDQQWDILRGTGTNHLVAISGLHIGMVAGFGFFPVLVIWWFFPRLYQKIPIKVAGGIVGAVFAIGYALLAGFTLPTQRALIMVLVVLFGLLARKQIFGSQVLAMALFAVLLFDPLAGLSQGFWLSFVAVGLILFTVSRRIKRQRFDIITIQFALSLGMLPLTLALFGTGSLSSPLANLLAIPWVTLVVVPLTLLGVLTLPIASVSEVLLNLAATSIDYMFRVLAILSSPQTLISIPDIPHYVLFVAFLGFLWLWLPAKFPGRWLGMVLMLPLLTYRTEPLEKGSFYFHLLDVGQGLASVVQTKNHVLIYDTGPRAGANFDTGKLVVIPFLRAKDINAVDIMIISHEDIDHRGGAAFIRKHVGINRIMSSDTSLFPEIESCNKGEKWNWDGVVFEMLSPEQASYESDQQESDNNRSCVLRVSNQFHSLLLTGDIQKRAERKLLENYSHETLKSTVMIMPHHGSKTSSLPRFINAVNPELALAATGYRNRFHFPAAKIVKRYEDRGIKVMSTAEKGAISLLFSDTDSQYKLKSYRDEHRYFWHKTPNIK